jgi:phosphoglycerate dehydrogenase-like enzyme
MKIVILSPITDLLFDESALNELKAHWEVVLVKDIVPLADVKELYDDEPKILAIDPDFCWWNVPKDIIMNLKNVKAICLQTTSFSWIDTESAKNQNIPVINLRWFSTEAVAEWAMMMALNVARKLPIVIKDGWNQDFSKHQGVELKGKTVGIVGLWTIGKRIAELCSWFGMNVVYRSRNTRDERYAYVDLANLMQQSDLVFPTLAQNDSTTGLITDEMLKSMKKTWIFVSIVHKIYNHELLLSLAASWDIYGYAFESGKERITDFQGNVRAGPELWRCTNESFVRNAQQRSDAMIKSTQAVYANQIN